MKNLIYSWLLASVTLAFSQSATLSGFLLNGSKDSTAMANFEVQLQKVVPGQNKPVPIASQKTNRSGRFSFSVSGADTSTTFVLSADYSDLTYYSEPAKFTPAELRLQRNLVLFDSSRSAAGVTSAMHYLFLKDDGRSVMVRETNILNNSSPFAIVGAFHEQGIGDASLRFQIPNGAQNFAPPGSNSDVDLIRSGDFIYDQGAFRPGNRQVSYVYQLPWLRNSVTTSLVIPYDARTFDIYVSNPNLRVFSQQLVDYGPFTIRGVQYRRLGTSNVAGGTQIELRLERDSRSSIVQNPTIILIFTLLLLFLGLLISVTKKSGTKRTMATSNRGQLESRKTELLQAIARLDQEISTKGDPKLKEERSRLFAELEAVTLELSKESSKPVTRKKK